MSSPTPSPTDTRPRVTPLADVLPGWRSSYEVSRPGAPVAHFVARFALEGPLGRSYPAGAHDRELRSAEGDTATVAGRPFDPEALRAVSEYLLAEDPRCRRVVLPVPEQDLAAIAAAEAGGFRYVVDVETAETEQSLLVVEPDWVTAQPLDLDAIPLD
ncbi:hypothetical protein GCM10022198_12960 [Klugiella xanthotipulae]|uniref:Acetyltransferase (GNAT) family protein n=1 Tax=Klugiella xanthotipulae TaxID=244735 RepID=A0A543I462_9MICO|nr:GNAT family N-acetyltransferase [Klugiella xanthotipulae]TQM65383.1 acetyltransferase (GNAT) family protein [Klugiella xanthotipulae]